MHSPAGGFLIAALALCVAGSTSAHETWLLPAGGIAADGTLQLKVTSGMSFPQDESAIEPARVTRGRWRQDVDNGSVVPQVKGAASLALVAQLPNVANTTVSMVLPHVQLELDAESVEEYLVHLGEPAGVRARWQAQGQWRERYRKSVKAFVRAGTADSGDDPRMPVGLPLEILPDNDLRTLHAGGKLSVMVVAEGRAQPGLRVGLLVAGKEPRFETTDAKGYAVFESIAAGRTLIHVTDIRPAQADDRDWDSDFSTLTLEVRP